MTAPSSHGPQPSEPAQPSKPALPSETAQLGEPPLNVTADDAPAGPGNDEKLARQGLVDQTAPGSKQPPVSSEPGTSGKSAPTSGRQAQLDTSGLRPGWTTGACAAAAARSAWTALCSGEFSDPVTITLPKGRQAAFALTFEQLTDNSAMAAVTKDAGDDPDVTHGAVIRATVTRGVPGSGVVFRAGAGVGMVTRPGLALGVGEPAINPVPRDYITQNLRAANEASGGTGTPDVVVTLSIDNGEEIAQHTWNPKIGIVGGLSVLGTTGVVVPYSCSAWIASIHEGIDVARASGATHAAACTGSTSQDLAEKLYPGVELLDMGDFAGAVLKYLHSHPLPKLTICGGFAKMSKLANGFLDLHSHRTSVDTGHLAQLAAAGGADEQLAAAICGAETAAMAREIAADHGLALGDLVARAASEQASAIIDANTEVEVICTDRRGTIVGRAGFRDVAHTGRGHR